ncbi:MAG TPA: DUF4434 domain-containing protein, partial [Prolixibacteraceae bacterium]|nr:DUF4434 domain-containing protein [Prolixibacteraceae bacterium]
MEKDNSRRSFLAKSSLVGLSALGMSVSTFADDVAKPEISGEIESKLIVPKAKGLKITGTFLDEISHDIPHQNWGEKEWDADFANMKAIGIDTVIMIRSGYRK